MGREKNSAIGRMKKAVHHLECLEGVIKEAEDEEEIEWIVKQVRKFLTPTDDDGSVARD